MTDIKQCMRDILAHESRAVAEIPVTDGYERAVGMIVEQVWNRHGKLITSGMGKAGQIAITLQRLLRRRESLPCSCTRARRSMATWA